MAYVERMLVPISTSTFAGGGVFYPVISNSGAVYIIFIDAQSDLYYVKSSDSGVNWSAPIVIRAGTVTQFSVWFDRWSNISAGKIHCAYTDSVTNLVYYRDLDTESSDTLGTERTAFTGASAVSGNGAISVTVARGGNIYIGAMIDAGAEPVFVRSVDAGANWTNRTDGGTFNESSATDQFILMPGWNADNQDIMAFFWDASADEISVKRYDDSGDTWAETSIAASMTDVIRTTSGPHWGAAVDLTNSQNLLVAWSAVDAANADLRCFMVTDGAVTETAANVVLNSSDDQGSASIGIDTASQTWYVLYHGTAAGTETHSTSVHVYYKTSTDSGATWSAQTQLSTALGSRNFVVVAPRFSGSFFTYNHQLVGALTTVNTIYNYGGSSGVIGG
jgi:hypothetical protein